MREEPIGKSGMKRSRMSAGWERWRTTLSQKIPTKESLVGTQSMRQHDFGEQRISREEAAEPYSFK